MAAKDAMQLVETQQWLESVFVWRTAIPTYHVIRMCRRKKRL